MRAGYPIVYRMTQAEFAAGAAIPLSGGFIDAEGALYFSSAEGCAPVSIGVFRTAGEAIPAHSAVYDVDGVSCLLADPTNIVKCNTILGVTDVATASGGLVVMMTEISAPAGFHAGPIFLGVGGTITQTVPNSGVFVRLGYCVSSSKIIVNVERPLTFI